MKVHFIAEFLSTVRTYELWTFWAWQEIRRQYHRTVFGPFWLTIGVIVYALALNLVFGRVFAVGTAQFMPWVTCGLIAWYLILGNINESAHIFPTYRPYILQSDRSLLVYLFCSWFRWVIIFAHHVVAAIAVLVYLGQFQLIAIPLTLLMLPVFAFGFGWISIVVAIIAARYRDIPPMIANIMQVAFFVTPIMFMPEMVQDMAVYLEFNPFTQLIALIREPMLGRLPSAFTFGYVAVFGILGWAFAARLYRRARPRVAYWL